MLSIRPPPRSTLFPYTTLFRSNTGNFATQVRFPASGAAIVPSGNVTVTQAVVDVNGNGIDGGDIDILSNGSPVLYPSDRKSTRLNSSHRCISYAVFCLKKKKKI